MRLSAGLAGLVLGACLATAEAAPPADSDTRSMIEALMPRTRSGRNLLVRQKPDAAASAPAAAASAPVAVASAPEAAASAPEPALLAVAAVPADSVPAPAGPPPSLSLAIHLEANSAHERPESGALLGTLVAAMQSPELKGTRFVIEGHSDASGVPAQNQRLSQERADEVRLYLVALGVNPARLKAVGKGSSQPVNAGDPLAAENRRVRVVTQE